MPGFEFGDSPWNCSTPASPANLRPVHQQRHPRPHHLRRDGGRKQQRRDGDGNNSAGTADANTSAGTAAEDPSANPSADHTLVACLRNRAAAVQAAIETPWPTPATPTAGANDAGAALSGIAIICAGERLATSPSVEDSFTAGACVYPLLDALPPDQLFLESGARLALRIFDAYGRDPARAFADSPHADFLSSIGYTGDLDFRRRTRRRFHRPPRHPRRRRPHRRSPLGWAAWPGHDPCVLSRWQSGEQSARPP